MYQDNLIALDLSKKNIQVAKFDKSHTVRFNRVFTPRKFVDWLSRQQPLTVVMEACSTANHWVRVVERLGHRPLLVATRTSNRYREGHKTNATDAAAVGVAARQPTTKFVAPKTIEQQEMQSVERIREQGGRPGQQTHGLGLSILHDFHSLLTPPSAAAPGRQNPCPT